MPKMKVKNGTDKPLTLKIGTEGIFTVLKEKLPPGDSYQLDIDTNATAREYWCGYINGDPNSGVLLSLNDYLDQKEVIITEKDGSLTLEKLERESGETHKFGIPGKFKKFGGLFSFKNQEKDSPSNPPTGNSADSSEV